MKMYVLLILLSLIIGDAKAQYKARALKATKVEDIKPQAGTVAINGTDTVFFNGESWKKIKYDSVRFIRPTPYQMQSLVDMEAQLKQLNAAYEDRLILILGVPKESIDQIKFEHGQFMITLKPKR